MVDITRVRRESLRWSLLVALNKTRPYTASETLLLEVSRAIYARSCRNCRWSTSRRNRLNIA